MAKRKQAAKVHAKKGGGNPDKKPAAGRDAPAKGSKISGKDYDKELRKLHVELVKLQQWVVLKGLKVCIVFEGRDGAGKGGTIKAITERVSPRIFRVVALPAPTDREKSQMYAQRYLPHLPAAGEIVIVEFLTAVDPLFHRQRPWQPPVVQTIKQYLDGAFTTRRILHTKLHCRIQ